MIERDRSEEAKSDLAACPVHGRRPFYIRIIPQASPAGPTEIVACGSVLRAGEKGRCPGLLFSI